MKRGVPLLLAKALVAVRGFSFVFVNKKAQINHGHHDHSRLFRLSHPQAHEKGTPSYLDSLMSLGGTGFGRNTKEKASPPKEKPVLRPHAPTTPRPSSLDDQTVLEHANDLLSTQEQIIAAAKSPTRRISDHEFYRGNRNPSPTTHYLQTLEAAETTAETDRDASVDIRETIRVSTLPKPHATSIELLRTSRWRAQNHLSRSDYERQKADEKKRRIQQRMEQELNNVEEGLRVKLEGVQAGIDEDVERMQALIHREMVLEEERMAQFNSLVKNLKSSIRAIQQDITSETEIHEEMKALRLQLDNDSVSAKQLDTLILRKSELLSIESTLLNEMNQCSEETAQAFFDCERRHKAMQSVLDAVCNPVNLDGHYDWADIDVMESVLDEAARDVEESMARVGELKRRIEDCLLQKNAILRESVADDMPHDRESKDNRNSAKLESSGIPRSIVKYSDLQNKDDFDVMKQLAISLGNATYSGSKATALALKTLFQAAYAKEVGEAADLVKVRTNQVDFGSNETFMESARAAFDSIVDTTKVFLERASGSDLSREAGESMKNVTNELISAVNAVSVLSTRAYQKLVNRKD